MWQEKIRDHSKIHEIRKCFLPWMIPNIRYIQKYYLLKLPTCTLEGATNNANQCWIQNITLPYKFVSPWLFICVTAVSLQITQNLPSRNTTNKIPVCWSFKMCCILITWLLARLLYYKTLQYMKSKSIYTFSAICKR